MFVLPSLLRWTFIKNNIFSCRRQKLNPFFMCLLYSFLSILNYLTLFMFSSFFSLSLSAPAFDGLFGGGLMEITICLNGGFAHYYMLLGAVDQNCKTEEILKIFILCKVRIKICQIDYFSFSD